MIGLFILVGAAMFLGGFITCAILCCNTISEMSEANSETRNEVKGERSQNSLKARNDRNEEVENHEGKRNR